MRFLLVAAFCLQLFAAESSKLPISYPHLCPFSTPNYSQCFKESLEQLGPQLLNGIREIGFPSFNPLEIPVVSISRNASELVRIEAVINSVKVWGFDTTQIKDAKFDVSTKTGEVRLLIAHLKIIFDYEVGGRLFGIDLRHGGYFKGDFSNFAATIKFSLKEEVRHGAKHYAFSNFKASGTTGSGFIKLIAKDPADAALADAISAFYNRDPQGSADAVRPIFDEYLTFLYQHLAEQLLENVPAKELFPE